MNGDGITSSGDLDAELAETRALSEKLGQVRRRYLTLTSECREAEQILADMKSSLFGLRVGAQVFEQLNVQPISDAVGLMVDSKKQLLELMAKSEGNHNYYFPPFPANTIGYTFFIFTRTVMYCLPLGLLQSVLSHESAAQSADEQDPIKTGDADDIKHLARGFGDS